MPLTEANTVLTPVRGIEILTSHQYPGQPLKAAVLFALLILGTRTYLHTLSC